MTAAEAGAVPAEILVLVEAIADGLADGAEVVAQVRRASVSSTSPTMIDLVVAPDATRLTYPDGPLPLAGTVLDDTGEMTGEVLVWVGDGLVTGLEQAWWTDETPRSWPDREHLRVE